MTLSVGEFPFSFMVGYSSQFMGTSSVHSGGVFYVQYNRTITCRDNRVNHRSSRSVNRLGESESVKWGRLERD